MHERARTAFAALLAGAVGIAFAPIFVRLSEVGPSATAFYRLFLSLPVVWVWLRWERSDSGGHRPRLAGRDLGLMALAGVFFTLDLALWHWSIRLTSVANATLLANFAPLFVALGARAVLGERIRPSFALALALALAGASQVVGVSRSLAGRHVLGDGLALGAAVFYGSYMLTVKLLRRRFSTATILAWSGLVSSAGLLLAAWGSGEILAPADARGWGILVGLALVSQVVGQGLIAYAFAHLPASFSSLSLLLQPAVAALLAWLLLGEPLRPRQMAGGFIILCGIFLAGRTAADVSAPGDKDGSESVDKTPCRPPPATP